MRTTAKILVTGASGFLGTNTVLEILNQGYRVRALVRDKCKFIGETHLNLELYEGNIKNVKQLKESINGCQFIIHIAAITDQNLLKYSDYHKINVEAVQNIINIAISSGVKKVIWVSTANVFGYGNLVDLGDETKDIKYPYTKSFYSRSKKEAHDFIKTKVNEIDIVEVNPTFMIGALDTKPSSGKIILMGLRNKIVLCPPGGKNFVCVKDVVNGIIKALKYGKNGESYLLANQNLSFYEFFKLLRANTDNKFKIIKLPKSLLFMVGRIGYNLRKLGLKTYLSVENMKAVTVNNYYSNEKAKSELMLSFKPIEYGIKEAVIWFKNSTK